MRARLSLAIFATWLVLAFFVSPAHAVLCGTGAGTCFVTVAGGNWNTNGTWSDSDGGVSCVCTPATGDAALLTVNSGASTINASFSLRSVDANGFTGTLTHSNTFTLTITGNDSGAPNSVTFRLSSGMTYTTAATGRLIQLTATSGTSTFTTNSKSLGSFTENAPGGTLSLGSALTVVGGFVHTAGTFTTNNFNVDIQTFDSNNSNVRALNMGSSTFTLRITTGAAWSAGTITNLTLNAGTSTISFAPAAVSGGLSFNGGTASYYNLSITMPSLQSAFGFSISGAASFNDVTVTNTNLKVFKLTANATVAGTLTYSGSLGAYALLLGDAAIRNLTIAGSPTLQWLVVQGINENGAGTITCNPCIDAGGNTSVVFVAPSTGTPGIAPGIR